MQTMERRKRGQRINVESRNDEALQWSRLESMILLEFPSETSGPNNWRGEESSGIRYRFQGRLALQDGLLFWLSLSRCDAQGNVHWSGSFRAKNQALTAMYSD